MTERDPVCGMSVDPAKAKASVAHGGRTFYFCCQGCADKFAAAPEKILTRASAALVISVDRAAEHSAQPHSVVELARTPSRIAPLAASSGASAPGSSGGATTPAPNSAA